MWFIRELLAATAVLLAASAVAATDSPNEKVVNFLTARVGTRIGGGECAQAVSEALRVAGAAFSGTDLGADHPDAGDYVWGDLVKVLSVVDDKLIDSQPQAKVLRGDLLQYHGSRFEEVTVSGTRTTTRIMTAEHHSSIVAKVSSDGLLPIEVFEQNAPGAEGGDQRQLRRNAIDFPSMRAEWVRIYRPNPRVDASGKYQLSIVNNSAAAQQATIRFENSVVSKLSLTPADTALSYLLPSLSSTSASERFSIVLSNQSSIEIENACGYEIYDAPDEAISIRKLKP